MKKNIKDTWEKGKQYEIDFWQEWIFTKGGKWPDEFISRMDPELPVSTLISGFIKNTKTVPRILDVGAGPLSCIGKVLPDGRKIELTALDPLAKQYSKMFTNAGVKPLITTLSGEVEKLMNLFKQNTFDLVFMRNALDHSYDPMRGIKQMIEVVKKGSVVILEHSANEAVKSNYYGFHQWNICVEDSDLKIWNKEEKINVTQKLKGIANVKVNGTEEWVSVIIEKL